MKIIIKYIAFYIFKDYTINIKRLLRNAMFNFVKHYKDEYKPSGVPREIAIPPAKYIVFDGSGVLCPTNPEYMHARNTIKKLAKAVKALASDNEGFFDYSIPPYELLITPPQRDSNVIDRWSLLIRQPDFITDEVFLKAKSAVCKKETPQYMLKTYEAGLCVHCMHLGELKYIYQTYKMLSNYIAEHGLIQSVSSERRTQIILVKVDKKSPEKSKYVVRIPVRRSNNELCPCPMSCSRHGKCEECISFHWSIKSFPYCYRKLDLKLKPIREAAMKDKRAIAELYKSLYGSEGCTWSDEYPNAEIIEHDIENKSLFVLESGNEIIGAISIESDSEHLRANVWSDRVKNPCSLGRLAVRRDMQGRGLAKKLMFFAINRIKELGFDSVVLLVCGKNKKAAKLYETCGFEFRGKLDMYDYVWDAYEKIL